MSLSLHIYERPGGKQLSDDLATVASGIRWSTVVPGGDKALEFTLHRHRMAKWPDLEERGYVEATWNGMVVWGGLLMTKEDVSDGVITVHCEGFYFSHLRDLEFDTSSSTAYTPGAAILLVVDASAPLIVADSRTVDDHDSYTIALNQEQYRRVYPQELFEEISSLGSDNGIYWDAYIVGQTLWHQPRTTDRVDWQLRHTDGLFRRAADYNLIRNAVRCEYRTLDGETAVTAQFRDDASIATWTKGVPREITLRENERTLAQANAIAKSFLNFHKDPHDQLKVDTSVIYDPNGLESPLALVRAGQTVRVPDDNTVRFIVETSYDHAEQRMNIIPEHGWTRPDLIHQIKQTQQQSYWWFFGRRMGPGLGRMNIDVARSIHKTRHNAGQPDAINAPSLGGVGSGSGNVPINDGTVQTGLNAEKVGGQTGPFYKANDSPAFNNVTANDVTSNSIGAIGLCDVGFLNADDGANVDGNLTANGIDVGSGGLDVFGSMSAGSASFGPISVTNLTNTGPKEALIIRDDDTPVYFVAMEGDITRFVCGATLTVAQRNLPDDQLLAQIVPTLPDEFLDTTEAPYMVLSRGAGVNQTGAAVGHHALIVAPCRSDLLNQIAPFGQDQTPLWETEYAAEIERADELEDEDEQAARKARAAERRDAQRERAKQRRDRG